ncbi:hypothetical protein [Chryseosolibacter indicus]|uniref:Uncharacterized protein n=1 Tax=Chryseosolibacter indicus TaxID=2782351 RepID=A0ABS5VVT3_9BACT|nr:hypothetical protein [Chryseosolibacter indicus]MBT1705534.1 hypothetical protein [Chryseosolibacter indicus]
MRKTLGEQEGIRKHFRAYFERFGKKVNYNGYTDTTLLLRNIVDVETQQVVTDHLWLSYTKGFEKVNLKEGMTIVFEARVKEYKKGYVNKAIGINNRRKDFKLSFPTKIRIVSDKTQNKDN